MTDRLTQKAIAAAIAKLSSAEQRLPVGDVNGLALVLRPSGAHAWRLVYRPAGSKRGTAARTFTLGPYPEISLEDARKQGKALVGEIAQGGDPAKAKSQKRSEQRPTVLQALDQYEAHLKRRKIVNTSMVMSSLRRGLKALAGSEVGSLTRTAVVKQINALADAGKSGSAAELRKNARSFLEFTVNQGLAAFNVLAGLKMERLTRHERLGQENAQRAFDDGELRRIWIATEDLGAFGNLVRLGLVTGLRRNELAGLRWSDIKADRISIPAPRTKMGVKHEAALSPLAVLVLARVPRGTSPLVFPSDRKPAVQMSGWSKMVKRLAKLSAVPDFALHGLRRTFRTKLSEAGISEPIAELCIGHQKRGLVKLYDHADRWAERVEATSKACTLLAVAVGVDTAKVTPLRPAAVRS